MAGARPEGNTDAAEVEKFSALASRWWDPAGEFAPLHAINPLRLGFIEEAITLDGRDVLDVGCGGGLLSEAMALRGARVTGIDLGTESLEVARLHALESGVAVDYRAIAAEDLAAQAPGGYDLVTCMEVLEHVPDPGALVAACTRLLRPGGQLVCSTLNRTPRAWLFAIVGAEYVLGLLPRGTHRHEAFIRPSELAAWARAGGLETDAVRGLSYNPVTRSYRLGADTRVNYLARFVCKGGAPDRDH